MTPAELVKETRARKGISQRSLAIRAGTSQSAIARIESGAEEVTWPRLRALAPEARLSNGFAFDEFATELAIAGRRARERS